MSRDSKVELSWADGSYTFDLPLGQLRELQTLCDAGPQQIADRLANRNWRVDDIFQTLRLGLIGGGLTPTQALRLCENYVLSRPLQENIRPAQLVLLCAIVGVPDDTIDEEGGEDEAGEMKANDSSETESSRSPQSTDGGLYSDTPLAK